MGDAKRRKLLGFKTEAKKYVEPPYEEITSNQEALKTFYESPIREGKWTIYLGTYVKENFPLFEEQKDELFVHPVDYFQCFYCIGDKIHRMNPKSGVLMFEKKAQFSISFCADMWTAEGYWLVNHLIQKGRYLGFDKDTAWKAYESYLIEYEHLISLAMSGNRS